jgi:hypothetical protein
MRLVDNAAAKGAETPCRSFIAEHRAQITGTLSGFERLVVPGTLRRMAHAQGMNQYLWTNDILLKDFGAHLESVSQAVKTASLARTLKADRPTLRNQHWSTQADG